MKYLLETPFLIPQHIYIFIVGENGFPLPSYKHEQFIVCQSSLNLQQLKMILTIIYLRVLKTHLLKRNQKVSLPHIQVHILWSKRKSMLSFE